MFSFKYQDNNRQTERYLERLKNRRIMDILNKYGQAGVNALRSGTPFDSGRTASAWAYEIENTGDGYTIHWTNDNINDGVNIAVILQYGHGTGTGGYVAGRDYINPSITPIFEQLANDAWKEVTNA